MTRLLLAVVILLGFGASAEAQWGRHRHHNHWGHHRGGGGGFAGGLIGGFIGGMIGGAITREVPPPAYDPVAECARRFRSYDPERGIYWGYDGRPRRCP